MVLSELTTDRLFPAEEWQVAAAGYARAVETTELAEDIRAELHRRHTDPELVRVLEALAASTEIAMSSAAAGPLALSSASNAYAAVYVWRHRFSIAVEPELGKRLHARHGAKVEAKTSATHYVQFSSDDLARPGIRDLVLETLTTAFARSFRGSRWTRAVPESQHREGAICDIHFMQKSVTGICPMCDD